MSLFKIKKEERLPALSMLSVYLIFTALFIAKYFPIFERFTRGGLWKYFFKYLRISGFDPMTYSVVTRWSTEYEVHRHPLLAFYMWPLYQLNRWLISLTGVNCMQFVVAPLLLFCLFYSFIFLYRILRELIGLTKPDAVLLSWLFFGMAYILLAHLAPDHFAMSMFLLLMTLYITGRHLIRREPMPFWQTLLLFLVTAGLTLSNGIKVFLSDLFANGKSFFRLRHLLLAVVLPASLLFGFTFYEFEHFAKPRAEALRQSHLKQAQTAPPEKARELREKYGKPVADTDFSTWIDTETPRVASVVENLFGESIQFHEDYFLHDIGNDQAKRPMIVSYRHWWSYASEALLVVLFLCGLLVGWRNRLLWLTLSWFAFDMVIHVALGFGLNEVYIMAPHWLFVVPIAIAYLLHRARRPLAVTLRVLLLMLTVLFWVHNGVLLVSQLLS